MSEYALYVGDTVQTVSLWVRRGDKEYPIYANTRGQCEWNDFDTDTYENVSQDELSDGLIAWLAHIHAVNNGLLESESESMFYAERAKDAEPDVELEWYEIELINSIGNPSLTPEQEKLLAWAYEQEQ